MSECCSDLEVFFPVDCLSRSSVAKENKREIRLESSNNFCKLKVDGCWLSESENKKCDFILFCCESQKAYLTELKGKNIERAIDQIAETYGQIPQTVKQRYDMTIAYVVASRVPTITTGTQRKKDQLKQRQGVTVKIQSQQARI